MRPVKNILRTHRNIGDLWNGRLILDLVPCTESNSCRGHYSNFDIACGGYRRLVEEGDGDVDNPVCAFYLVESHPWLLSDERDGRPIE